MLPYCFFILGIVATFLSGELFISFSILTLAILWFFLQKYFLAKHKFFYTVKIKEVYFTDNGIGIKQSDFEGLLKWTLFHKVIEDVEWIMIFHKTTTIPIVLIKKKIDIYDIALLKKNLKWKIGRSSVPGVGKRHLNDENQ